MPLSDICQLRRLTFCTYIRKKLPVKTPGRTSQDGVLMAAMRSASDMREDTNVKGADIELGFWLISILWLE